MKDELRNYIQELQLENDKRAEKLNEPMEQYKHTVLVHQYNLTIKVIKKLKTILLNN